MVVVVSGGCAPGPVVLRAACVRVVPGVECNRWIKEEICTQQRAPCDHHQGASPPRASMGRMLLRTGRHVTLAARLYADQVGSHSDVCLASLSLHIHT